MRERCFPCLGEVQGVLQRIDWFKIKEKPELSANTLAFVTFGVVESTLLAGSSCFSQIFKQISALWKFLVLAQVGAVAFCPYAATGVHGAMDCGQKCFIVV